MSNRQHDALEYHASGRPGKIEVVPSKPTENQRDLSLAYTPGVAEPCRRIEADPEAAYAYTAKGNLVAVVSNGTAVLGLGDIGPLAGKPVMEGKGVLFKRFADLDVFDLEINATTVEEVVRFCVSLEPTVGGINLEDIKAPDCFHIEEQLRERLEIPVFHDDQHGTAIISGAALINAVELSGKRLDQIRVVFVGAGAAALATAEHYVRLGVTREHIILCDRQGIIHTSRDRLDPYKARFAVDTDRRTVEEAFQDADVFVGLSVGGTVTQAMVRSMASDPIIFALANPDPEILPDEARRARPDAMIATGRSDFPNQVNNVLGFPYIFRGALDVRARAINEAMKMAATRALAALAKEDIPDSVLRAYGVERLRFGPEYLIPKPLDPRVLLWVAPAVAKAAIDSGVARTAVDLPAYRDALEARLGPAREIMRTLSHRAATTPQRVALTAAADSRVLRATRILQEEGTARPILIGDDAEVRAKAAEAGVSLDGVTVINPATAPDAERFAHALWRRRQRKGMTLPEARRRVLRAEYFGALLVVHGEADALVVAEDQSYVDALGPVLRAVGASERSAVAGIYMMVFRQQTYFFADCTVNIDPDARRLVEITTATADVVRRLGIEPRIALLSFTNFGSARHPSQQKVSDAVRHLHAEYPDLEVDGEMQADTAVVEAILSRTYPFTQLRGPANTLIFPDLNAANISYKLLSRLAGARAIGPILVGLPEPIHVMARGADVDEIVNIAVIAAVDALERDRQHRPSNAAS